MMTPEDTFSDPPLMYRVNSVSALKEERVRLTAPLFCHIEPYLDNFTSLNETSLLSMLRDNQAILLDDLLIYLA
jgi:hypothetical protein